MYVYEVLYLYAWKMVKQVNAGNNGAVDVDGYDDDNDDDDIDGDVVNI